MQCLVFIRRFESDRVPVARVKKRLSALLPQCRAFSPGVVSTTPTEFSNISGKRATMMRASFAAAVAITAATGLSPMGPALGQDDTEKQFGTVHFATSCNETAQRRFDRAMRYQHSFWYQASKEIFDDVLKADPECGIAYWGIALSLLFNPHAPPPAPNLPLGLAAIQKGKAVGAKTQRERDYIDALAVFYTDYDKMPHGARVQAYLKAMEALAQKYPDDDEAQIFYAITLNVAASPNDKTYSNQLKGAALLEPIFRRQPRHPGVAHYLIHLYDTPALAEKGLDAARRYAGIAPAAPHAQHMPSHIFTRVGAWNDSIASNIASARAAKDGKDFDEQLHAMDYMVYAYLQLARDQEARVVVDDMNAVIGTNPDRFVGPYALAVAPARYALERGDWKGAAQLQVKPSKFAYADAMTHFARALGAARSGNPEAARADVARLAELRETLRQAKDSYWAEQVDIQRQVATAWVLYAEGKYDDALKAMSAAADAEDKTEKHPVTPGVPTPARELLGAMLLDREMAREALAAFEATIKKEPNRFNAVAGAARAAERLGDNAKAKDYYQRLTSLANNAGTARPALVAAREFLAKN
jgi:tetratricopeptide (TPR) repeat protein